MRVKSRLLVAFLAITACFFCWPMAANAQGPRPGVGTPTPVGPYSPYLNLFRRDASFAQNYYGLVRPQFDFRNSIQGLQTQLQSTNLAIGQLGTTTEANGLPVTGHTAVFLNTGGYFQTLGRGGAPGVGAVRGGIGQAGGTGGQVPQTRLQSRVNSTTPR